MTSGGRRPVLRLAAMLVVWGWLLVWSQASVWAGCVVGAVFLLGLWAAVIASAYEGALVRRLGFVAHYLQHQGILARWMSRRSPTLVWQGVKSLPVALVLLTVSVSLTAAQWILLLADILVVALLLVVTERMLRGELATGYAGPFARMWVHRCNALVLWVGLMALAFHSPQADYRGLSWETAARAAALQVEATCDAVAVLARVNAVSEALGWWAAQNFLSGLQGAGELLLSWLLFLAFFGVSFLVAWAYSRALAGVLSSPWRIRVSDLGAGSD